MRRPVIAALLLLLGSAILGATILREPIAGAARLAQSVVISNTPDQAVPVREQNKDGSGNIKVHEQGTANVNVTNSGLSVVPLPLPPVTDGGGFQTIGSATPPITYSFQQPVVATALAIHMTGPVTSVGLEYQGHAVAAFRGPQDDIGSPSVDLALTRPVAMDSFACWGSPGGYCTVSWVGAEP